MPRFEFYIVWQELTPEDRKRFSYTVKKEKILYRADYEFLIDRQWHGLYGPFARYMLRTNPRRIIEWHNGMVYVFLPNGRQYRMLVDI